MSNIWDWQRVFAHEAVVAKVEEFFRARGGQVQRFGQESFFSEEFHKKLLDQSDAGDTTAAFIRYRPDLAIVPANGGALRGALRGALLCEVKGSLTQHKKTVPYNLEGFRWAKKFASLEVRILVVFGDRDMRGIWVSDPAFVLEKEVTDPETLANVRGGTGTPFGLLPTAGLRPLEELLEKEAC